VGVNVFISYASEYRPIAEKIAVGLVQDGHETFFDRDRLPPAEGFHAQIREAIAAADLVVFLLSPESIESSSYALTELNLVKERWPNPSQRVLPVLVNKTPYEAIPAYLGAVTILEPRGNVVADVLAEVARIERRRKRPRVVLIGSGVAAALAIAVAVFLVRPQSPATTVMGSVRDAVTGNAVANAQVEMLKGSDRLGSAISGSDGGFSLAAKVGNEPAAQTLKLTVRHEGHEPATNDVVITSGSPDRDEYAFELLPTLLVNCRRESSHLVVVGYFRPPSATADPDLSARIKDTLNYELLTHTQLAGIEQELQPLVVDCGKAQPQADTDYHGIARALKADAFLAGYVTSPPSTSSPKVKVEMRIADQFGVLKPPARTSSPDVNLDDPAAAQLSPEARVAILTALVAGYEHAGNAAECVEASNAAAGVVGALPEKLAQARERCLQSLPNRALLRGNSP
jgi:TIR domain-containing protein